MSTIRARHQSDRKRRSQNRQRRIKRRLKRAVKDLEEREDKPVLGTGTMRFDVSDRVRAHGWGGLGLVHQMVGRLGLARRIDESLELLKYHRPYHESDHVLAIAYNIIAGGTCLEDMERLRQDEALLDNLGTCSLPDPTTAGDFCRRFKAGDIERLMDVVNDTRVRVWKYRPARCEKTYRIVALRKELEVTSGQAVLWDEVRYFFYITNVREQHAAEIVLAANLRCAQEKLIDQLKNEVRALRAPVDNLQSNWAWMVMSSLAWSLMAWMALLLPTGGRWAEKHEAYRRKVLGMGFRGFVQSLIRVPVQVILAARQIKVRLLAWNPMQRVFLRFADLLERPALC